VCPDHCFFVFLLLPLSSILFFAVVLDKSPTSASVSANQKHLVTINRVFPNPQFFGVSIICGNSGLIAYISTGTYLNRRQFKI
jgi:hypothetical protein